MYGLTAELFNERVKDNHSFMTFYAEAHAIWHASSNSKERVSAKAGVIFEQWLREANRLMHDPANPMAAKVDLGKTLAKLANFEPVREADAVRATASMSRSTSITLGSTRRRSRSTRS